MAVVQYRATNEHKYALEAIAAERGLSLSDLMRQTGEQLIREHKAKKRLQDVLKRVSQVGDGVTDIKYPAVVQPVVQERGVGWTD